MLVLSRRLNERVLFPTIRAAIQVVAVKAGVVRLGISAPADVPVLREEVSMRPANAPKAKNAMGPTEATAPNQLTTIVCNRLRIAAAGLDLLERHLEQGNADEARAAWAEVFDEIQSLRLRLEPSSIRCPEPLRPFKALLVEDDRNERELLAGFLRTAGVHVDTAGDGTAALDYLHHRQQPDVVLLDMGLPHCDGASAVRAIRSNPRLRGLKIFAVSGHLPEEFNLATGPAGIDRWFHKPLDPMALLRDLNQELSEPRSRV
jgi:carbon storage regulator CsrA